MSRYVIPDNTREIVVGWDPPLATFFATPVAPERTSQA